MTRRETVPAVEWCSRLLGRHRSIQIVQVELRVDEIHVLVSFERKPATMSEPALG